MPNLVDALVEVRSSSIHGMGLFAKVPIPRGTLWWKPNIEDVIAVSRRQFELMEASACDGGTDALIGTLLDRGFYLSWRDAIIYICDLGRFTNHSFAPNSMVCPNSDGLCSVTTSDVVPGTELTEDYTTYERCPWARLYGAFGRQIGFW